MALLASLLSCAAARHEPAVRGLPSDDAKGASFSAVWIGHATVLFRFGARRVLTDPNLGGAIVLYPRLTPPSVSVNELPPLDAVLISHMHVDHFDLRTMRGLGRQPLVLYPQGGDSYTSGLEQRRHALKPWESVQYQGLRITAVPVAHEGGRYGLDAIWNHAFTGFVIEGAGRTVFFAGDTGADAAKFKAIRERFPHIDVAFIPIAPARGGNKNHASPAEALDIFTEVGARYLVPIHYEAYYSMAVPYDEPRRLLEDAVEKRHLEGKVFALRTGERLVLPDADSKEPWVSNQLPPGVPEPPRNDPPPPVPARPIGKNKAPPGDSGKAGP